ncbi:ATP-dependent metallopeptidase FtsH/Yme1/Tma family protein [Miltoncostaea marina]|uniref:ATP-dependent metallopeptidase FtsH/Yme1/Tma family protein n=1 Tax=Miltoncostaea marina TaxID=2843215 RepID=UPI001C3E3672|nr:AAA family ATPase [Miltoncostaea marina]
MAGTAHAGGPGAGAAGAADGPPIALSRALELLEAGDAQSARLTGGPAAQRLILRVGGRDRGTALPTGLTERVIDAARAGGVPLRVVEPAPQPAPEPVPEGGGFDVEAWMQTWGPMILLAGLVIVSALALRMAGGARFAHRVGAVRSTTRFDDVAGIDEIRDEVGEIAEVLRAPDRYRRVGAELPRGIILHGPPGTGKTLLARAVAGEAGVPFFSASGSEFVEVYSGLGSKRIRALFAAARKAAPAVVYIDEIDAVGGRRTGHAATSEREQTLDQLLTEMDGFAVDPARPVVVLASTNRLDALDPALIRAGRFDRKIAVGLPGREARREILDVHLRGRPLAPGTDPGAIAAFTVGMAGADLAALCNEASFEAARAGTDALTLPHFRRALMRIVGGPERRSRIMSEDERLLVAYHEMGHALVGHLSRTCDAVERVTVIPQGQALGVTIALPAEDRFLATREECMERLAMMMAGRAAEELVFGEFTTGAADDLDRATTLARRMVRDLAMAAPTTAESLAACLPGAADTAAGERVEDATRELVERGLAAATALLRENLELLHRAASRLMEAEELERDDLVALFGARPTGARLTPRGAGAAGG